MASAKRIRKEPSEVKKLSRAEQRRLNMRKAYKLRVLAPPERMTARQMYYAMNRVDGLPPEPAMIAAGYATTSQRWSDIENSESVRDYMRTLSEQAGITPQMIMEKMREGLDATAVKDFCSKDGDLVSGPERTDFQTRLMYIQTIGKWLGLEVGKQDEPNGTTNVLIISDKYKDMSPDALRQNMQKLRTGIMHNKNVEEEIVF